MCAFAVSPAAVSAQSLSGESASQVFFFGFLILLLSFTHTHRHMYNMRLYQATCRRPFRVWYSLTTFPTLHKTRGKMSSCLFALWIKMGRERGRGGRKRMKTFWGTSLRNFPSGHCAGGLVPAFFSPSLPPSREILSFVCPSSLWVKLFLLGTLSLKKLPSLRREESRGFFWCGSDTAPRFVLSILAFVIKF